MARKKKNVNSPSKGDPLGGYIEVRKDVLADALALLKTVLVKRASRKDLASIHFEAKPEGKATVAATDMENSLQLKLPLVRSTGVGRVMIDSHALEAMLGAYAETTVRIHLDNPREVRVEGQATKLKLPGYDPEKEMKLTAPGSLTSAGWIVRADTLASAIKRTRFAMDDSGGTRYSLGGLALNFPTEGDTMELVATDGRRLTVVRLPVRAHGKAPARTCKPVKKGAPVNEGIPVVLMKAVNTLLRIAQQAGGSSVGLAVIQGDPIDLDKQTFKPGRVQAVTRDAALTTQLPEGRYPHWRDVIPTGPVAAEFYVQDATKFRNLLATAVAACDSEHKGVEFTMAGGCVMIESGSGIKGKTRVYATEVEMTGKGTVTLDGLMLRQFFDVIGNERLRCKFFGPKDPVVFHAGPDQDFVLMPLTRDDYRAKPAPAPAKKPDKPEGGGSAPVDPAKPTRPCRSGPPPTPTRATARPGTDVTVGGGSGPLSFCPCALHL